MAIFTFIAAYPELYAGYEAEVLTLAGDIEGAREYHFMSAAIRIARGIRLLEFFLVGIIKNNLYITCYNMEKA